MLKNELKEKTPKIKNRLADMTPVALAQKEASNTAHNVALLTVTNGIDMYKKLKMEGILV